MFTLPLSVPSSPRLVPDSGTNLSSVFGIDSLRAVDMSEEQLENLELLRALPLSTLESWGGVEQARKQLVKQVAPAAAKLRTLQERLGGDGERCISDAQLAQLVELAKAEKRAGYNSAALRSFCISLRKRYRSLGGERLEQLQGCVRCMRDFLSHDIDALHRALSAATLESGELRALVDALQPLFRSLYKTRSVPAVSEQLAQVIELETSSRRQTYVQRVREPSTLLSRILSRDSTYTQQHALLDCEVVDYLLCARKPSAFLDELFYRLSKIGSNFFSVTPAELMLPRLVSNCLELFAYTLLLYQLALAYLASYDQLWRAYWLDAASALSDIFRSSTEIGELLGATATTTQQRMLEITVALFPGITGDSSPADRASMVKIAERAMDIPGGKCWSYSGTLPWLPEQGVGEGSVYGPLGVLKSDSPLQMLDSDQWMHLKWLGFVGNPTKELLSELSRSECWESNLPRALVESFERFLKTDDAVAKDINERMEQLRLSVTGVPLYFDSRAQSTEDPELEEETHSWETWE